MNKRIVGIPSSKCWSNADRLWLYTERCERASERRKSSARKPASATNSK